MTSRSDTPAIAHLAESYYSLTENWIYTQTQHLVHFKPIVLTFRTANLDKITAPEYYALYERPHLERWINHIVYRFLGYHLLFHRAIRRNNVQLLHAHFGFFGYRAMPLAKRTGLPLVTTFYGVDASGLPKQYPIWRKWYRRLFEFGSRFLVEGPYMGKQLIGLGCPEEKIKVHHLGIHLNAFPFQPRRLAEGKPFKILVAGRFTEKKGIMYAVEAFARLLKKRVNSRLTIIGDAAETGDAGYIEETQTCKKQILNAIERNGLSGKVSLKGMQPHNVLKQAYYDHHVLLAPSVQAKSGDNEGGAPVTLIEAAATGMPAVASYHCDIPEVVQDGITGFLAPERDSAALANHLLAFVNNPHLLQEMGAAAHKYIEIEYNAVIQGQRLASIYERIIGEGSQAGVCKAL